MAEPGKCGLKIQLLGAFEIWREDLLIPLQAQSRGKAPAILKVLLSERGRVFSQDQLIEVLFSDLEPAKAAHNLHARISELRRALEPELKQGSDSQFIRSAGKQGYCFPKDAPCSLDTEEFQNHYQTAQAAERTGRWAEALEGYQQAVQLYRGDYLAEDPYEEWTLASREEWRELFLNALLRLADCQAHLGQYAEALETCRKAIKQKPSAEAATRQMMIYHCLLGEHSAALQAYRECAKALEKELEVQPSPETEKLHEAILKGRMPELEKLYPRPTVAAPARHNLPSALTSFIGRGREMLKIKDLLNSSRLLTLAGIGGCGKTRLALQVAGDLVEEYSDGVWLVELAALSDPKLVPQALASTLGVREQAGRPLMETLADHLQAKCLLLVLDNCEHLLAACAQLADALLRRSPHLRILATSRETLGITGEVNFPVPPMARPDQDQLPPLKQLAEHEAVRLFVERALSSQPHFALTDQNAPVVVQICHRLDGLPLAIELAAAQVKVLSAEQIAQRLDERFRLLTGGSRTALPRQQTLQGTMDWSWELLAQPEQVMFRRLSVFAGGFALEAAEAVCAGEGIEKSEVLGQLTSLVETSLVIFGGRDGEVSYTLLETVQQYAGDKLRESREMDHLQVRHLAFFLQLAERAEAELTGPDQKAWFDQLEVEHDNLRAALNWSTRAEGDAETALRLAGALGRFWEVRGYFAEGRDALGRALAGTEQLRSGLRVKALWWAGALAHRQGDYEQAKKLSTESLQLSRELGDKRCIALSLNSLGIVTCDQGDFTEAQRFHEESLALRRELGDKGGIAASLNNLGAIAYDQGDFTEAWRFHEESLALSRELGDKRCIALSLNNLGIVTCDQGDFTEARRFHEESLALSRELGDKRGIALSLNNLGVVARYRGNYAATQLFHEESLALSRELGDKGGIAMSLNNLGFVACDQGNYAEARRFHEESLALRRELGDKGGIALTLSGLGTVAVDQGDYKAAQRFYEESLALFRELADKWGMALTLSGLGTVAVDQEDYKVAQRFHQESLSLREEIENKGEMAEDLEGLAKVAYRQSQADRAAQLFGSAEVLREAIGAPLPPADRADYDRTVAAVRAQLGEEAFAESWAEGRAMTLQQAVEYALKGS